MFIALIVFLGMFIWFSSFAYHIPGICLALVVWGVLVVCIRHLFRSRQVTVPEWTPFFLGVLTFVVRCGYCLLVDKHITQVSDFGVVLSEAQSGVFSDRLEYYRIFLHKFIYPFLLHTFHMNSQTKILIFQCVCVSFVTCGVYLIGKKVACAEVGLEAGILYALWPAQTIYTSIVSEEHVAALLTVYIILWVITLRSQIEQIVSLKDTRIGYILLESVGIGLLCGATAFFKDWAAVILVASIICSLYLLITYTNPQRVILILCMILCIFGRGIVQKGVVSLAEHELGIEVNNDGVIYKQMYTTLAPDAPGDYNEALIAEYMQMAEDNDFDFAQTNKMAMEILWERIRADYKKMPNLLLRKAKMAYENDSVMFFWAFEKGLDKEEYEQFADVIGAAIGLDTFFYLFMLIGIVISAVTVRNKDIFFMLLCILGGMMVSLIIESQGRYKYSIEPLWTVPVAYSIYMLCQCDWANVLQRIKGKQ